jgi:hypothetical protein
MDSTAGYLSHLYIQRFAQAKLDAERAQIHLGKMEA